MTGPTSPERVPYPVTRLSVIRAGAFTASGTLQATSMSDYKADIGRAADAWGNRQPSPVGAMPWTRYRNRFWQYQFGNNYEGQAKTQLCAGLLPFSVTTPADGSPVPDGIEFESLRYPFGVATALHVTLPETQPRETEEAFGARIDEVLDAATAPGSPLEDGAPASWLGSDADGLALRPPVVLISGLREPRVSAAGAAQRLAERYGASTTAKPFGLSFSESAMCVRGATVGVTMPTAPGVKTGRRFQCFHHNLATLLMTVESLLGIQGVPGLVGSAQWYQSQAAKILIDLHLGTSVENGTVYKSPLSRAWIDRSGLVDVVNAAAPKGSGPLRRIPPVGGA